MNYFLLSPARCSGIRASYLLRERARSQLALRLHTPEGAPLGEVFTFMSGLYFRGKLTYAAAFGAGPQQSLVIAPGRGLLPSCTHVTLTELQAMAEVPVDVRDARYADPLRRDVRVLQGRLAPEDRVVLLGSIATAKYTGPLVEILGERLLYPKSFAGRGDMSRGALLLRCARRRRELLYVPAEQAASMPRSKRLLSRFRSQGEIK